MKLVILLLLSIIFYYTLQDDQFPKIYKNANWKILTRQWIVGHLKSKIYKGLIDMQLNLFYLSQTISRICFSETTHKIHGGHNSKHKMLCGSLHSRIDDPIYDKWLFRVPDDHCMNISIIRLPTNDEILGDLFNLTINYVWQDNVVNEIMISKNYNPFNVITSTPLSEVILNVSESSWDSDIFLFYQATECNVTITLTVAPTINTLPHEPNVYFPQSDTYFYHMLIRGDPNSTISVNGSCADFDQIEFYEGPGQWAPKVETICYPSPDTKEYIMYFRTFMIFLVFQKNLLANEDVLHPNFNISYVFYNDFPKRPIIYEMKDKDCIIDWDFTNTSEIVNTVLVIEFPKNAPNVKYKISVDIVDGIQGHMCQYGGVLVRHTHHLHKFNDVGPICSKQYARLIDNLPLQSKLFENNQMVVLIYNFWQRYAHKGKIHIFHEQPTCVGIINPCYLCSSDYHLYKLKMFIKSDGDIFCPDDRTYISIIVKNICFTFYIIPNEEFRGQICTWNVISYFHNDLEHQITKRYFRSAFSMQCLNKTQVPASFTQNSTIKKYYNYSEKTYAHVTNFNFKLQCQRKFVLLINTTQINQSCRNVVMDKRQESYVPEYVGKCLKFKLDFSMKRRRYAFKVYFSKGIASDYMNRFKIICYINSETSEIRSKQNQNHNNNSSFQHFVRYLKLSVKDEIYSVNEKHATPLIFNFTGDNFPMVWKSYGQFLTIDLSVETGVHNFNNFSITLIALAIFNHGSFETYYGRLHYFKRSCPKNATHVLMDFHYFTPCWSVHTKISSDWYSAKKTCEQRSGHLWIIHSQKQWDEVLSSSKYFKPLSNLKCMSEFENMQEYTDYLSHFKLERVNSVNALRYFRHSSIFYLGMKTKGKVSLY